MDKEDIPDWARNSYLQLAPYGGTVLYRETEELGEDGTRQWRRWHWQGGESPGERPWI